MREYNRKRSQAEIVGKTGFQGNKNFGLVESQIGSKYYADISNSIQKDN